MKQCILCGKVHDGGCDKSEWDGVLKQKYNVPETVAHVEEEALKHEERQHVAKRRGRKPKNA